MAALAHAERAARIYRGQRARHNTARVRELLARCQDALGHGGTAEADRATALAIYRQLGAGPDLVRLAGGTGAGNLSAREAEVLALVARGLSNRAVAQSLVISDKTVGRHLANIFAKIGVSSRTAAAAWARGNLPA
ncbi:response regulator transcription factor [Pseudarthrobacter sp. P1]|uniref:response regulator transcription factor n=1 Tax=Pseudarthrobacter sp. P1 TaxID=3418418 RepID=UPI003CE86B3B